MWKFTSSCLYQVVRLLSRMMMQLESWLTRQHSSCHCHTEVKLSSLVTWRFPCTFPHPRCSLVLAVSHSDSPNDGNRLPSTVAWSLWVSTADKLNRFVFKLNNDCKTIFTEDVFLYRSRAFNTVVAQNRRLFAQGVSVAAALAAAASQQLLTELQATVASVWPGNSRCARHTEENSWAKREWG